MDRYGGLVWSLCRRMLPDSAEAEDAAQEIFTELWQSAKRFDASKGSEVTFVAVLARRRLIDRARRRERRPQIDAGPNAPSLEQQSDGGRAADQLHASVDAERVGRALAALAEDQRQVVTLCIVEGLSHGQAAERTGLPLGTVKSHARRGLIRLRELLETPVRPEVAT